MAQPSKHGAWPSQKTSVLVLSLSLTTFLVGGIVGSWATRDFMPEAGGTTDGPNEASAPSKPAGPQAQLVRVGIVERKPIVPIRTLVGDLVAVRRATVPTEVAGKIIDMPVDEGTKVKGGETLLARIDDTWTTLQAERISAQIAEKKATLNFERSDYKRYMDLLKRNAVSESEATQKRSLTEELQASVSQLEIMLREANERKARLEITAPFDGTVVSKQAEVGEYVSIGSEIVEIVSTGRIYAQVMVPEEILPLLSIGDPINLVVDSFNLELQGTVSAINAQGSVGSRTFPVRVELDDEDGRLLPGMGVSVFVPVMHESTELIVPRDAVLTKPDESTIWVLLTENDKSTESAQPPTFVTQPIPVHVLSHTRDSYAIHCEREVDRELIVPGMQVVTEGLERLVPGAIVRVDPDHSQLAPVPGTYRTGQQVVDRPGASSGE